ncbi:MAG: shikimate dehydrogenase [Candidatus Gracilibacteria bacterium]
MTKQYGLLAFPAKHSLSPEIHSAAFKALSIDAQYGLFEIPENELDDFVKRLKSDLIAGLSVSLPYKEVMIDHMSEIDDDAKKIGAINTVVNRDGILCGYNTDFIGSNKALKEAVGELKGKKVVILGAGGAARAVIYGLLKEGACVVGILNRTLETAENLAKEFSEMFNVQIKAYSSENLAKDLPFKDDLGNEAILIQTTSIWTTNPDISEEYVRKFCPPEYVGMFATVMDIIYRPRITPLLKIAEDLGKKIITGDKMFLYQATEQFKLWTEKEAPFEVMRNVLEENL